jgi:hypothetical protein
MGRRCLFMRFLSAVADRELILLFAVTPSILDVQASIAALSQATRHLASAQGIQHSVTAQFLQSAETPIPPDLRARKRILAATRAPTLT